MVDTRVAERNLAARIAESEQTTDRVEPASISTTRAPEAAIVLDDLPDDDDGGFGFQTLKRIVDRAFPGSDIIPGEKEGQGEREGREARLRRVCKELRFRYKRKTLRDFLQRHYGHRLRKPET